MGSDVYWLGADGLATAIRERRMSAREVVEAHVERIATQNPRLNAVITLDIDGARRRADEADAALARGEVWGPLHGVPATIKDSLDTAGLRTTSGFPPFAKRIPTIDAGAVAALRRRDGAIILGKTNLPLLAMGCQANNPLFGRTNNPWDVARTPGGSTGGGAAAVAAGLSPLDVGSDISGSLRVPASFCGVFGLKATAGRIPTTGHVSSPMRPAITAETAWLVRLASVGPVARSVADLRLALAVLADPSTRPLGRSSPRSISELRIAWTDRPGGLPVEASVQTAVEAFVATLSRAGCHVERRDEPGVSFGEVLGLAAQHLGAVTMLFQPTSTRLVRRLAGRLPSALIPGGSLQRDLLRGCGLGRDGLAMLRGRLDALAERADAFFDEFDLWLAPTYPTPAFTHRPSGAKLEVAGRAQSADYASIEFNVLANALGQPAVAVPAGRTPEGLPIGVQLVGRRWGETELLDAAETMCQAAPFSARPPDQSPETAAPAV